MIQSLFLLLLFSHTYGFNIINRHSSFHHSLHVSRSNKSKTFSQVILQTQNGDYADSNPISKVALTRKTKLWEKFMIYILSYLLASISVNKSKCMKYVYPGMDFVDFVSVTKVSKTVMLLINC